MKTRSCIACEAEYEENPKTLLCPTCRKRVDASLVIVTQGRIDRGGK